MNGSPSAAAALRRGSELLSNGDHAAALPWLIEAASGLPDDRFASFRLGAAAFLGSDFPTAADAFQVATRLDPEWIEAWNNLAASLIRLQRDDQALLASRAAIRLAPGRVDSQQTLAALLSHRFDRESLEEGLLVALQALRQIPSHAQTQRTASILQRKLGNLVQAEWHARRAVAIAPADPSMVELLADTLEETGRTPESIALLQRSIAVGVVGATLVRQLGIALLRMSRVDEAVSVLESALRSQPDDQRTIAHLGAALAAAGRVDAAEHLLGNSRHITIAKLPTPDGFEDDATFYRSLASDIRRHSQQRWEPIGLAARESYLSGDLLRDRTPAIVGFETRLRAAIDAFIASAPRDADDVFLRALPRAYRLHVWATRAAQGGFIDTHIHEQSWMSGAYYVELPSAISEHDPERAGWIEFGRPHAGLAPVPEEMLRHVQPKAGDLLLFPSYLFHRTRPYHGDGERISVSFDLAAE